MSRWAVLMVILAGIGTTAGAGAATLPTWPTGHSFTVNQHYAGNFSDTETGMSGNADITADGCTWTVSSRGPVALCGASPEVYTVEFGTDCPVIITGHITITDPVPVDADFRLTQINLSGRAFVATDDLNLLGLDLAADARMELYLFGSWTDVGTIQADIHAEACPELKDFDWPLTVGGAWTSLTSFKITGSYEAHLNILGLPIDEVGDIDEMLDMSYDVTVPSMESSMGCNAYLIQAIETTGLGTMTTHYCETWGWYSEKEITDLNLEGFTLTEILWELTGDTLPQSTPTPPPGFGVDIVLATDFVTTGNPFSVDAVLMNDGAPRTDVPFFCILEVFGTYYFYPSWSEYPPDIDYEEIEMLTTGNTDKVIIPTFTWPAAGGPVYDLYFYGAFLNPELTALDGSMDMESFGYGP